MPNVWEASREVDRPSVRGVRIGAGDWQRAARARHEIRRRELVARNDARRETRSTQGGAMTDEQMVEWSARLLAVAVFGGVLWLVTR